MAERTTQKDSEAAEPATVDAGKVALEAAKAVEPAEDADAIPVQRLITEGPAFLGVESFVVAGALSSVKKKSLTLAEAKAAVKTWLAAPIVEG